MIKGAPRLILNELNASMAGGASRGTIAKTNWALSWRFGDRRIEDKLRENVLVVKSVHLAVKHRRRGYMTRLLRHLDEYPVLDGRRVDWIYFEQVNWRFANHLERDLRYRSDFGMVIDCWRRTTGQLELTL